MSKSVKLKMNASSGKIDLQCSEGFFEEAMNMCIDLLSVFQESGANSKSELQVGTTKEVKTSTKSSLAQAPDSTENVILAPVPPSEENKPKRQRSSSGKTANYSIVDLGLSDDQCRELKQFYELKSPKVQNDIVSTVTVKIKELTQKNEFSVDDIFSALRLIGGVKIPKNLIAVINNMFKLGLADRIDGKLVVNFATEDRVNLELPESDKV